MSGGLMSWLTKTVTESKLLSDVAGKAKAGVETVMTTLDPGMKPFLAEHGVVRFVYKFLRFFSQKDKNTVPGLDATYLETHKLQ